ncbi:T9SS type A sorting domain-containing protein [candidate division KSB1 bacterium]|nr:T9SS type A sorting domain-containing protein [candidate division KSB1 bacterium]
MKTHSCFSLFIALVLIFAPSLISQEILFEFPTEPGATSLAIDAKGDVYVANASLETQPENCKIQKYTSEGIFIKTFIDYLQPIQHKFNRYAPLDLTLDDKNQLYVLAKPFFEAKPGKWTAYNGFSILQYDSTGALVREYSRFINRSPTSLFYHNKSIFMLSERILQFHLDTGYLTEHHYYTEAGGSFVLDGISDFVIDSNHDFWATGCIEEIDVFTSFILKIRADGLRLMQFQIPGRDSSIIQPRIAISNTDDIYLTTDEIGELQKFNSAGHILGRVNLRPDSTTSVALKSIAVSPKNNLYIPDAKNQVVRVLKAFETNGASISGKVMGSQQQPGQATIHYSVRGSNEYNETFTDEKGFYFIGGLKAGEYNLWAYTDNNYLIRNESRRIQVAENEAVGDVNFEYLIPASVSGQVVGAVNLNNIRESFLQYINFENYDYYYTSLENDGRFSFTNLWPGAGEIYIIPPASTGCAGTSLKITLQEGDQVSGLKIALPKGALVSGYLKLLDASPIALRCFGVSSTKWPDNNNMSSGTPSSIWPAQADENGYYELRLVPGRYFLNVVQGYFCSRGIPFFSKPNPYSLIIVDEYQQVKCDFIIDFRYFLVGGTITDQTGQFLAQRGTILAISETCEPYFYSNFSSFDYPNIKSDGTYTITIYKTPDEIYSLYAVTFDSIWNGMSVWGRVDNLKGPTSSANFNLSDVGGKVLGKVVNVPVGSYIKVRILDTGKKLAGEVDRHFVAGDFEFGFTHIQPGQYEIIAYSSAHPAIPKHHFVIQTGESIEIPPLDFQVTSVETTRQPVGFELFKNFPNPFNTYTQISFHLSTASQIELAIYNLAGQPIRNLFKGKLFSGGHLLTWDGSDNSGRSVASGIYFYQLKVDDGNLRKTEKMVLIR